MGQPSEHLPVLLVMGAFSQHGEALSWAREKAERAWGNVALASDLFPFVETGYYTPTMGAGIQMQFLAFERLIPPTELVRIKLQANEWEAEYAAIGQHPEPRPLNLDPGYLTPAKLVLASTKDHTHRIYLSDGIFAEVTLNYKHGVWRPGAFTFPNYQRPDYHEFFSRCRVYLRNAKGLAF